MFFDAIFEKQHHVDFYHHQLIMVYSMIKNRTLPYLNYG